MKKLLVVLLAMAMTLALATCAAAASVVYVDRIWEGTENVGDYNWNGTFIGGGSLMGKFKFGAEYGIGQLAAAADVDMVLWNLKGGYRIVENNGTMLDVVLVYLNLNGELANGTEILSSTATMIGLDFTQYFSKDLSFSVQYNYSLSADTSYINLGGDVGDNTVTVLRAKVNYFFSETIGASLGYQSLVIDTDSDGKIEDFSALSLGIVFRFM